MVRVHELVPAEVWCRRNDHINTFERLLAESATIMLKFAFTSAKMSKSDVSWTVRKV